MQAVHRVEHVGHDARARVEAGFGGLVVGVAVAHGRHHAGSGELADGGDAVGQFGGDGDLADAAKLAGGGVGTGGLIHTEYKIRQKETFTNDDQNFIFAKLSLLYLLIYRLDLRSGTISISSETFGKPWFYQFTALYFLWNRELSLLRSIRIR